MYPILETKGLVLKPLHEDDFDNMFKLVSDPDIISKTEWDLFNDPNTYKKEFNEQINSGSYFTIRNKENDDFIGFFILHQYIDKKKYKVKYSQLMAVLLPKCWRKGFCTEITEKILHFAFIGIKTPWICANQLCTNPAAGKVLKKCGFVYYKTYKMEKGEYDQYRITRDDYIKKNAIDTNTKDMYNYSLSIKKSQYSYKNPIRKIENIKYIKEPTGYLCGQSVIAMLAGVSVDEVINVMETDKGTSVATIDAALTWYGIKHGKTRKKYNSNTVLPEICILSIKLPEYGHWSLYFKGTFFDPEFGILKKCPIKAKLEYYWEIEN